jgi:proteasome accessory factor A
VRALDVLAHYFEAARAAFAGRDPETDWVLDQWGEALDAFAGDPSPLADRVDWLAKRRVFDQVRGTESAGTDEGWGNPLLRRLDLAYHLVDPDMSLYTALIKQGRVRRLVTEEQVATAAATGPLNTRGAVRAMLLARFGPAIRKLEWDSVTFGSNGREVRLQFDELSGPLIQRIETLVRQAPDLESLFTAIKGGTR